MGDREIKQFNRILFAKFGNRTQELHLQRLHGGIKSVIDNTPPPTFAHLADRRKIKQKWSDEQARIEFANMLLLSSMRRIMTETQNKQFIPAGQAGSAQGGSSSILLGTGAASEANKGSLNRGERIREMKRILHENESLLSRIQSRGPTYDVKQWEHDHMLKEKQLASMGRYPYNSSTLPKEVMEELRKPKPLKRYGTIRYPVPKPGMEMSSSSYSSPSHSYADRPSSATPNTPPSKTTPRRVHHLPPKSEEKSQASSARKSASAARKRKAKLAPVEVAVQLDAIDGYLPQPASDSSSGEDDGAAPSRLMPRVILYLRSSSGDYIPHSNIALQPLELATGVSYRGATAIPALLPGQEDRRVRIAIFSPLDPAFSAESESPEKAVVAPSDNSHLLGEARFSLAHFTSFPRLNYKLKVLRHGLPIGGPQYGAGMAEGEVEEEELQRRRALPEAILVLQYTNKPPPPPEEQQPKEASPTKQLDMSEQVESKQDDETEAKAAAKAERAALQEAKRLASEAEAAAAKAREEEEARAAAEKARAEQEEEAERKRKRAASAKKRSDRTAAEKADKLRSIHSFLNDPAQARSVLKEPVTEDLAEKLCKAAGESAEFVLEYLHATAETGKPHVNSETLTAGVSAGSETRKEARRKIQAAIDAKECHLLPREEGKEHVITLEEVDQLATDADLPLSPLAPVCKQHEDDILKAFASLEQQGLTYKAIKHLAVAVKKDIKSPKPAEKSAAEILAEIQSSRAAQEAEVARVMKERGITALEKGEYEEEEEEFSKPYIEDAIAPSKPAVRKPKTQDEAASKIQALYRGRSVRTRKATILEERRQRKEETRKAKLEAEKLKLHQQRDDAAAKEKHAQETAAREAREKELAEEQERERQADAERLAKVKADEEAALEKKRQEEAAAKLTAERDAAAKLELERAKKAELEVKIQAAAEAKAAKEKADADLAAAEAERLALEAEVKAHLEAALEKKTQEAMKQNRGRIYQATIQVGCKGLPEVNGQAPSPMVALYGKDDASGAFSFISQSERVQASAHPTFAEGLAIEKVQGGVDRQMMFSVYNVLDEEQIREQDVTGTALLTQKELYRQMMRISAGGTFTPLSLPIAQNGSVLKGAFLIVTAITFDEVKVKGPVEYIASSEDEAPFVVPDGEVGVWVVIKNIILPPGVTECNSLAALYTKDHASTNFNYVTQSSTAVGLSPSFSEPLCIARPKAGQTVDCMLNVYNHLSEDSAEVSDAAALGACLFSLNKLLDSSRGAIASALVRAGQVVGQVILKTSPNASSAGVTRPNTASALAAAAGGSSGSTGGSRTSSRPTTSSGSGDKKTAQADVFELTISCSKLPARVGHDRLPEPMVALYGQDPSTQQFSYVGQSEKSTANASPVFESKIRIDEASVAAGAADRALLFMAYDVADENNIQESDQIGTAACLFSFLKEQSKAHHQQVTLPLLQNSGEQHKEATITIHVQKVGQ